MIRSLGDYSFLGLTALTFLVASALIFVNQQQFREDIETYFDTQRGTYDELLIVRSQRYVTQALEQLTLQQGSEDKFVESLDLAYAYMNLGDYRTGYECINPSLEKLDAVRTRVLEQEQKDVSVVNTLAEVMSCQLSVAGSKEVEKRQLVTDLLDRAEERRILSNLVIIGSYVIGMTLWFFQMGHRRTAQRAQEEKRAWERRAQTDSLTNTLNRGSLNEYLDTLLRDASFKERPLTLFMYDLDYFKRYNDQFGHIRGDQVLREVTSAIQDVLRPDDKQFRYGGEEFIVVTQAQAPDQLKAMGERMLNAVRALKIPHPPSEHEIITISIGQYSATTEPENFDSLIEQADERLYQAKKSGRNRLVS